MTIHRLPIRLELRDIPAIPFEVKGLLSTVLKLGIRVESMKQATHGLSNIYTIDGQTAPAYPFLFGESDTSPTAGSSIDSDSDSDDDADADSGSSSVLAGLAMKGLEAVKDLLNIEDSDDLDELNTTSFHRFDSGAAGRARLKALLQNDSSSVQALLEKILSEDQPMAEDDAESQSGMTRLSLDHPEQFSISWTNFANTYRDSLKYLKEWASSLTDADEASRQFWPMIAVHGLAYNLLVLRKVDPSLLGTLRDQFGDTWNDDLSTLQEEGHLYAIDLSIFESVEPQQADGSDRLTPASITLLRQDPETKDLTPVAVRISGHQGDGAQIYLRGVGAASARATDGAWIYALQAARASVTVYGIWLGHVYHWHIVTGALQMTLLNTFSESHPLYQLLAPQSKYLISFDDVLLLTWESLAPPTSITSGYQFLELCNTFAKGREYFDDDPISTLERHRLKVEDFTDKNHQGGTPWNKYPIVSHLLEVWEAVAKYVDAFVEATYKNDQAVADDRELQKWIKESGRRRGGNVRGLPNMNTRAALARVLASFIYRVTMHGNARLTTSLSSALLFTSNYPPCLQRTGIPAPTETISTHELLSYLPKTGTIGKMVTFYFIFLWSTPYEPIVPLDGVDKDLWWPGGMKDPRNMALAELRESMARFMTHYQDGSPETHQWPLNVET